MKHGQPLSQRLLVSAIKNKALILNHLKIRKNFFAHNYNVIIRTRLWVTYKQSILKNARIQEQLASIAHFSNINNKPLSNRMNLNRITRSNSQNPN